MGQGDERGLLLLTTYLLLTKCLLLQGDEFGPLRPVSDEPSDLRAWRVPRGPRGSRGREKVSRGMGRGRGVPSWHLWGCMYAFVRVSV